MKPFFIVLFIIILKRQAANELLKVCAANTNYTNNSNLNEKWYTTARFYSYCMQINGGIEDLNCSTPDCQSCMLPCRMSWDRLKNKTESVIECKSENRCKQGCNFYLFLLNETESLSNVSHNTFNMSEVPDAFNKTIYTNLKTFTSISYSWDKLKNVAPVVYLIFLTSKTIHTKNTRVLGMTTAVNYKLSDDEICHNNETIFTDDLELEFKVDLVPLNFHGISITNMTSGFKAMRKIEGISSMSVSEPKYVNELNISKVKWIITWENPSDVMYFDTVKQIKFIKEVVSCENNKNNDIIKHQLGVSETLLTSNSTSYLLRVINTENDNLDTCTISAKVTPLVGKCLVGVSYEKQFLYKGCQFVSNYPNGACSTSTTPKPTYTTITRADVTVSSGACITIKNVVCFVNLTVNECPKSFHYTTVNATHFNCAVCMKGFVNIHVDWNKPITATPIKFYRVIFGKSTKIATYPMLPPNQYVLFPKYHSVNNNMTTWTIYNYTVPIQGVDFGIKVTAVTDDRESGTNFQYMELYLDNNALPEYSIPPAPAPATIRENNAAVTVGIVTSIVAIIIIIIIISLSIWRSMKKKSNVKQPSPFANNHIQLYMESNKSTITDEWEIFPDAITLDEKIGEGAFGTVFSANVDAKVLMKSKYSKLQGGASLLRNKNGKVALKLLKEGAGKEEFDDFREEITLMKSIGYHKNIVNLIGCSTINQPLCLIVEYLPYGDFLHYLRKKRSKLIIVKTDGRSNESQNFLYTNEYQDSLLNCMYMFNCNSAIVPKDPKNPSVNNEEVLTTDHLVGFVWQIATGMEYLAENNIVHRDLAARNVLVGYDKVVKISDFGLTRRMLGNIYITNKSRLLPVKWMSVEAIFHDKFTSASDVWAFGILLMEIITLGCSPYPNVNNRELLSLLKTGYRMERPDNCAVALYDIMLHCWNEDPKKRPTFTVLREQFEKVIHEGDNYLSFDVSEENNYLNVSSNEN